MTSTPEEIVKKLREGRFAQVAPGVLKTHMPSEFDLQAASLIESQQEEIKRLREALEPFANLMLIDEGGLEPDEVEFLRRDWEKVCPDAVEDILIEVGWVKAARAALKGDVKCNG